MALYKAYPAPIILLRRAFAVVAGVAALPVMLFWMVAGFLITLVFHPDVFHDLLCPYGVLQRIMAKLSFLSPEGRETARNYQGFTKSVLGGGNQPGDGKPQA